MAKSNEIRVLLVRTGETEWERAGRLAGATDVPLSAIGVENARRAAQSLAGVRLSTIFCGPDEASQATAAEVAAATGGRIKVVEDLGEINLGLWEGMLSSDLEEKCPRTFRQWLDDPASVQVPEGENIEDASGRITDALTRVLDKARTDQGAVGVVLRPVAMALVSCELTGAPTRSLWSIIKSAPSTQWRTVQRGGPRGRVGARAGA